MKAIFIENLLILRQLMYPLNNGKLFMTQPALRKNLLSIVDVCRSHCFKHTDTKSLENLRKKVERSKNLEGVFWEILLSLEGLGELKI